jgi:flagellin-like protein
MKGITPIISIIILLLITIGLASAAWTYMSGYMTGLLSRIIEVSTASCISGTQVTFLVKNSGTNNVGISGISNLNLVTGSSEAMTWEHLNGSAATMIGPGETVRAKITNPCTTTGVPKTCQYELALTGTTWKQQLAVPCTG